MSCHWLEKTLTFEHQGTMITLKGVQPKQQETLEEIEPDQLHKWQAGNDIWYMAVLDLPRATEPQATKPPSVQGILDDFAAATGLGIIYGKITLVAIHVADEVVAGAAGALSCSVQGFPQPYLGLPLSWDKLTAADFAPMIAKVDAYLAGRRARLLSPAGRLVLINAVLDALPTYAMAAMLLPPAVIKALDSLRRAFLWNAAERASSAQCLVAWERTAALQELEVASFGLIQQHWHCWMPLYPWRGSPGKEKAPLKEP